MYRKEVGAQSPLRILEATTHGGLGVGNLGVVMSRAGVGKTACLVQIALDDLLCEREVLHVTLEQKLEHVESWYDALLEDLASHRELTDPAAARAAVRAKRVIHSLGVGGLYPDRLERIVQTFRESINFRPKTIVVDGWNWSAHTVAENAAMIGAFKAHAGLLEAELWMSAQTHRGDGGERLSTIPPPCADYDSLIDVAIYLEPRGSEVAVCLLKDHDHELLSGQKLFLDSDTGRMVSERGRGAAPSLPNGAYTLLSGGAEGAEECFGDCAEEFGLEEINFSFEGRTPKRLRGLVKLSEEELDQGAVSSIFLDSHLHRAFPKTPLFQRTLKSIWHQVNTAQEVFSVGVINADNTVKGGTGWAVELARIWNKPVFVYDQERRAWFTWRDHEWLSEAAPIISARRFTGTGTRFLSGSGREAVRELFRRSFS